MQLAAEIAAGLSCCSQLTHLTLRADDVTSQHLSQALLHLSQLRELTLSECASLDSLSFLSECRHLSQSLQTLTLWGPPLTHSEEIKHVLTLSNLTQLALYRFFVELLEPLMVQRLTPPSRLLPKLVQFRHKY